MICQALSLKKARFFILPFSRLLLSSVRRSTDYGSAENYL
jgi:hypothetical protein